MSHNPVKPKTAAVHAHRDTRVHADTHAHADTRTHTHPHTHKCSAGCCHDSLKPGIQPDPQQALFRIDNKEIGVLLALAACKYLPVSRFVLSSSKDKHIRFTALEPVYINAFNDTMEEVKELGGVLYELEGKDLISIDYDIPLRGYDYFMYTHSSLFAYFQKTVDEGKSRPDFLGDTAEIELGSIALTAFGEKVAAQLNKQHGGAGLPV